MKKLLSILLALLLLVPCLASADTPFTYIYLDCKPCMAYTAENIPFVILTNRPASYMQQDSYVETLECYSSVYFWNSWEKRYYQMLENYQAGVTGQAQYAAVIRDYDPATMSGHLSFAYHGRQDLYHTLTCETYLLSGDDYYEYVGAMIDIAASDAMYDARGNRIHSEKQIARNLHDWLCERMTHSESVTMGGYDGSLSMGATLYRGTGYGGLHTGVGKCTTYAGAYQMLLRAAGIECFVINGTAGSGSNWGGHEWNVARLDGQWVFIDVTWDDNARGYDHDYFAVSKAKMDKNHKLDDDSASFVAYLMDGRFDRAVSVLGR